MTRHVIIIEGVSPSVDCGAYPAKGTVGQSCVVEADIFRDGHGELAAQLLWRKKDQKRFVAEPLIPLGNDHWRASFTPKEVGTYVFTIEVWADPYSTWLFELQKKVHAGDKVVSEVLEGAALLEAAKKRAKGAARGRLGFFYDALLAAQDDGLIAVAVAETPELRELWRSFGERPHRRVLAPALELWVDRPRASFAAWYELFPRSQGQTPKVASSLREAARRLPDIAKMGFDVVYLPPIHPIGTSFRKGKNNSLIAREGDPGSPWAIGNSAGGHTAIEPALGTFADFDYFVAAAREQGLEVALDFAIQCSPDHPWVREHPEWFFHRPDGTIKYAENPPKKYQDVYPVSFDAPSAAVQEELWHALRDILLFWAERGVCTFRVDNPHTKPLPFWTWVIEEVRGRYPSVVFLAEAFTRPRVMQALAKVGFTQSYTYFTWRNTKAELTEYLIELTRGPVRHYFRPNFWPNTPDILPPILQKGGRPAFMSRLLLAATLSPLYGIYSGYELCENAGLPGREEYQDSEKYEVKVRDWDKPGNIKGLIAQLNGIRRDNVALQELTNLEFLWSENEQILFFGKKSDDNVLLIAINLDPHNVQESRVWVPPDYVGVARGERFVVDDLLSGASFQWLEDAYVRLDPEVMPGHILRLRPRG